MMNRLALVIRSTTWEGRSGRDTLDVAMAAAVMDFELDLFFLGRAVQQLIDDRDPQLAGLPKGYRAWASLEDFTRVRFFADAERIEALKTTDVAWLVPVRGLGPNAMAALQSAADRVLVLQ